MIRTGNLKVFPTDNASSNSRRGRLEESAIKAKHLSPKTLCATYAKNAESTPPEYATRQEPYEVRISCKRVYLSATTLKTSHPLDAMSSRVNYANCGCANNFSHVSGESGFCR